MAVLSNPPLSTRWLHSEYSAMHDALNLWSQAACVIRSRNCKYSARDATAAAVLNGGKIHGTLRERAERKDRRKEGMGQCVCVCVCVCVHARATELTVQTRIAEVCIK